MSRYLMLHKDHRMNVRGVNAGAEMATLHLARFLVKAGHEVVVAAQLAEGECEDRGVTFWDLGPRFELGRAIERMRAGGAYHVISAGRSQPFFLLENDPLCLSKILISHDRSGNDTGIAPKVLCERLDRVVCVSEAQRQVFLEADAPKEKVVTIRNGVDLALFPVGPIENRDWNKIVFVGALVQDKGLHVLLESYAKLKAKYTDLTLDIYGSSDLWGRSEMFDQKKLESQLPGIKFHGKVAQEEVSKAFQHAGICAVPSIWFDPFPLTSIEAQVTGCPVVTFNVGGLGEGVRDGVTGRVLNDITEEALTEAFDQLLGSPETLQRMSKEAALIQREYFTWERVVNDLVSLQDQIVSENAATFSAIESGKKLGIMSTWNQKCGLATYARFLTSEWNDSSYHIFAEDNGSNRIGEDESNVSRCWTWQAKDWSSLVEQVKQQQIEMLLVNAHNPEQLGTSEFEKAIAALQEHGVRVQILLHSIFTKRDVATTALQMADGVIVHTPEMKLEIAAHGVSPERIQVITHGIRVLPESSAKKKQNTREQFGLPADVPLVSSVGFIQPHKGIEGLIEAIHGLKEQGIPVHGCIAGMPNAADPKAAEYASQLKEIVQQSGLSEQVTFIERFLEDDEVSNILQVSDAVFMNYHSQHYEASGACSLALGAHARVLTSLAPPFHAFGGSVWHMTSGFPPALALHEVLNNTAVQSALDSARERFIAENGWRPSAKRFSKVFQLSLQQPANQPKEQTVVATPEQPSEKHGTGMSILVQNRQNMITQRGGDTILIEHLIAGLEARGIKVDLDLEGKVDPAGYDLVHLINFAIPQMVQFYGERAKEANVPFVVTTLCEDVPTFHNQSRALADTLVHYVRDGQSKEWFTQHGSTHKTVEACQAFPNEWAAENAAALIVNGNGEKAVIQKTYPQHGKVSVVPVGYEIGATGDAQQFIDEHGIKDFVLCVGRLESRKNQLMLAKALEDVDIPLVFAGGGFSYQPDYAESVKNFKRAGETIVLDRLSPEMLASAYAAAKVHALPSWYELPGLVSLEAIMHGCNVVACNTGTTKDYLGDYGFYCQPDDEDSIRNAVVTAFYSPVKPEAQQLVANFTWDAATDQAISVYEQILGKKLVEAGASNEAAAPTAVVDSRFNELAEKGFTAANERKFADAHRYLAEAERMNPKAIRVLSNRAAVFLAEENIPQSREYFEKALVVNPKDSRARSGLGMCFMMENDREAAYPEFVAVLEEDSQQMVAMLQLLDCAYGLDRYDDLERVLYRFLESDPLNFDMRYCLAGCLLRQEKLADCEKQIDRLLEEKPEHGGTLEMQSALKEKQAAVSAAPAKGSMIPDTSVIDDALSRMIEKQKEVPSSPEPFTALPFDSIDVRLGELEELKHRRDLEEVIEGCDELLKRGELSDVQRRMSGLLRAESIALTGDVESAEEIFREYIESEPNCARTLCGLGAIVASKSDNEGARIYFDRAIKSQPGFDKALTGLAFCELQMEHYPQSWHLYEQALESNPENLSALLGVIQLGYQLEKLPTTQEHLERYLDMHPADLNMVYSYAGCLYAQQRLDEALSEVQRILLFQAEDERALELRNVIEEKMNAKAVSL